MLYVLETMAPDQVNRVIHTKVLGHPQDEPCYGPIEASLCIRGGQRPSTALWSCQWCKETGEYDPGGPLPPLRHQLRPPEYVRELRLALQIIEHIHAHWGRAQKLLYDFYLFGIERKEAHAPTIEVSNMAMIDRFAATLNPKLICYAAIHTLNALERQKAERSEA